MTQKIADRGVKTKSKRLDGKRIALGVCGGIGATEVVKIIRELRRHGASVVPFLTPSVTDFISELSIEWAASTKPVLRLGADVDHLETYDLVVVAPATLNTIAKSALGIADNAVTLLVASQIGRKAPVIFVPAMNLMLRRHPAYDLHVKTLTKWGASFFEPEPQEERLKMPEAITLAAHVVERLA